MIEYRYEPERMRTAAYDDGSLIAICQYQIDGMDFLITHTETAPSYQGQGIARQLVEMAAKEAIQSGYTVVPVCSYAVKVLG